jgi:hypothetical protein
LVGAYATEQGFGGAWKCSAEVSGLYAGALEKAQWLFYLGSGLIWEKGPPMGDPSFFGRSSYLKTEKGCHPERSAEGA